MTIFRRRHEPNFRWHALATYNAERARGIVHTETYQQIMADHQAAFDYEQRTRAAHEGAILVGSKIR